MKRDSHSKDALRKARPIEREDTRLEVARAGLDESPDPGQTPDVLLDIPTVKVDEIKLEVDHLEARVALKAELANLVRLDVGAEVGIGHVNLDIKGVEAQALLKVRLKQVAQILERALGLIDRHPEILTSILKPVGQTVSDVGATARETLAPGGPVARLAGDVGGVAKEVVAPGGAVSRLTGDAGHIAKTASKGALAPGGVVPALTRDAKQLVAEPTAAITGGSQVVKEGLTGREEKLRRVRPVARVTDQTRGRFKFRRPKRKSA